MKLLYFSNSQGDEYVVICEDESEQVTEAKEEGYDLDGVFNLEKVSGVSDSMLPTDRRLVAE